MVSSRAAHYDTPLPDGGIAVGVASAAGSGGVGVGGGGSSGVGDLAGGGVGLRRGVGEGVGDGVEVGSGVSSSGGVLLFRVSSGEGVGGGSVLEFKLTAVPSLPVEGCMVAAVEGVGTPVAGMILLSPAPVGVAPGCTGDALGSAASGCELSFVGVESELL